MIQVKSYDKIKCSLSKTQLEIRFADVDMMGVVHHSTFIHWLEKIRFQFLKNIMNIEFNRLKNERVAFPVIDCHIKYFHYLDFNDQPVGYAKLKVHKKAIFTFYYAIYLENISNKICAVGSTTHCYLDRNMNLIIQTPRFIRKAFDEVSQRYPESLIGSEENPIA